MNNAQVLIRQATLDDLGEMQRLFVDTISAICRNDYSPEQIKAWTASAENTTRWIDKVTSQYFLIAEINNTIAGYASLQGVDYLDFLYVHKDYQRQGVASYLYLEIEKEAMGRKAKALQSDVSITARPFFEKQGFKIIRPQTNSLRNIEIFNYHMSKQLLIL